MIANGKKQFEIISIATDINKKTGVFVSVYLEDGTPICNAKDKINIFSFNGDTLVDKDNDRVIFKLRLYNEKYFGVLQGTDKGAISQSLLIKELIENSIPKGEEYSLEDFYRELLIGNISYSESSRYQEKYKLPADCCECLLLSINGKKEDIKCVVESYIDSKDKVVYLNDNTFAIIRFENTDDEYRSSNEFADFLLQSLYEEVGVNGNIYIGGKVNKVFDLATSYDQALLAFRMSKALQNKGNIHNHKEYMLFKMLEDIPKVKLNEYLDALLEYNGTSIFDDEEMTETAEEFLDNSLNVSETSRKLYLHRNTLTYRLDKIEKETGLDVRKFSDAVTFRLITLLKKLLK